MSYINSKLYSAVYVLATGEGDVRSRLADAYRFILILSPDEFPKQYQEDWKWIKSELVKRGPINFGDEQVLGSVRNTLRKMRNKTASKIANKIVNIYFNMEDGN